MTEPDRLRIFKRHRPIPMLRTSAPVPTDCAILHTSGPLASSYFHTVFAATRACCDRGIFWQQKRAFPTMQARFALEQQREALQRRAAGADARLQQATAARDDAATNAEATMRQLQAERGRCAELQGLLASLRAAQFGVQQSAERQAAADAGMRLGGPAAAWGEPGRCEGMHACLPVSGLR